MMIRKMVLVSLLSAYSLIAHAAGLQIFGIYSAPETTLKSGGIFDRQFDLKEYIGLGIAGHFKPKRWLMVEGSVSMPDLFRNGSTNEHKTISSHGLTGLVDTSVKWMPRLLRQLPYVTPYVKTGLWLLGHVRRTNEGPKEKMFGYGLQIGLGTTLMLPFLRKLPLDLSWTYHHPLTFSYLPQHSCEKGFSSIRLGLVFLTF